MTASPRTDLLALTPDTLAALANRGLVRRATKDLDAGSPPELSTAPDGAVTARFADGAEASMPPGASLDGGSCGCGAAGVCRHLVGLVLAYQRATDAAPLGEGAPDWSPGDIDDAALEAAVGARALSAARRTARRGVTARVHRPTSQEPHPWVELPTCTVRFPVPGQAAHALTDAADTVRREMLALALWAFRTADTTDRQARLVLVSLRTPAADGDAALQEETDSDDPLQEETDSDNPLRHQAAGDGPLQGDFVGDGPHEPPRPEALSPQTPRPRSVSASHLRRAVELADELLRDGVAHADPVQTVALRTTGRRLAAASLHWPAAAAKELADQLDAYADRDATHRPEEVAALLAELHARHRAADHPEVLGTRESAETPLRRVRLTALGCRVSGSAERPVAEVYFAHAAAGVVLVLRKDWPEARPRDTAPQPGPGGHRPSPPAARHALASRRLLGTTLSALATGNLVSENARRTPSRRLTLTRGRLAATTVSPVGRSWAELPAPLLVREVPGLAASTEDRPPRLIRARVEAESVRVVELSEVLEVGYDPAEQVLKATVRDAVGNPVFVHAPHNPLCPDALDALAVALVGGEVRYLSGAVRHVRGQALITPLALLGPDGVVVPDLAPPTSPPALPLADRTPPDPVTTAVEAGLTALADAAHHGLRRLPRSALDRLREAADRLTRTGLATSSSLLRRLLDTLDHGHGHGHGHERGQHEQGHHVHGEGQRQGGVLDVPDAATRAWTDACIRLLATSELTR
ncbi:hypothetical protein ACWD26_00390 [Streptomyces sp. NPDC002787]